MSKVDTDQGLGPGSERKRQEVLKAQEELESGSKQKAAAPADSPAPANVDKNAVTAPGIGKVERRSDTVDDLLDGFGTSRPDLPRILPKADTTPPPEPVKKELTPTSPGRRQRTRNTILATAATFAAVVVVGFLLVKLGQSTASSSTTNPSTQTPSTAVPTQTQATTNATSAPTETIAPIATMAVDSLPTAVKTSAPPPSTTKSVHSTTTSSAPTATAATTTSPRPTGSAPPGMNLLPDDPHR